MKKIKQFLDMAGLTCVKFFFSLACILFSVATLVIMILNGNYYCIIHCVSSIVLVSLPALLGRFINFRVGSIMYIFLNIYALSPVLGEAYQLYTVVPFYDDILHFTGGVVFAIFGVFLFSFFSKGAKKSLILCGIFALCFSISISAIWEIAEFSSDRIFHTDTQKDTVITEIHSTLLTDKEHSAGSIENIKEVTVNGAPLQINGYLEIGLLDTMRDVIMETAGAFLYCIIFWVQKNKKPIFFVSENQS